MGHPYRLVCLGILAVLTSLSLEAMPSFVSLDFPGAEITVALGVNPAGEIVGTYLDSQNVRHGYWWSEGQFTPIDFPGALQTSADGINRAGHIVGGYLDGAGVVHGFLRGREGAFASIDFPGALHTLATAINASGKIVGAYTGILIPEHQFHGYLLDNGHFTPIDFPGANLTIATGINSTGDVVGAYRAPAGKVHGFLLRGGAYTTTDVPGAIDTFALGISALGDVVGQYKTADGWNGFVMSGGAFETIDFPGGTLGSGPSFWPFKENAAYGTNSAGKIVGQYRGSDAKLHGYLLSLECEDNELLSLCMAREDDEYSRAEFRQVATALANAGLAEGNVDVLGYFFTQALKRPAPVPELYDIPTAGQAGRDTEYTIDQWWSMLRTRRLVGLHTSSRAFQ
jgi:uncharacterized membrane protein